MEPIPQPQAILTPEEARDRMLRSGFVPQAEAEPRLLDFYGNNDTRSFIMPGTFAGRRAVCKIIHDPRERDVVGAHQRLHTASEGTCLRAPRVLYSHADPRATLLIMEALPEGTEQLQSPLSDEAREEFLRGPFADVIRIKDKLAYRKLDTEGKEDGDVIDFYGNRLRRWRALAEGRLTQERDAEIPPPSLLELADDVAHRAWNAVNVQYSVEKLRWAYGLSKPDKFHRVGDTYYITDAKLIAPRGEGYELAMAVWADAIMPVLWDEALSTEAAVAEIERRMKAWTDDWARISGEQGLPSYAEYIPSMFLERLAGTAYADTLANKKVEPKEAKRRLETLAELSARLYKTI
ncbi:MAG: hypothetical protein KIH62_004175 [Candidatus Kerfeldbacteria bacterium]|nr:hypothetical protein [Candidatus Kerfeldbacteria bacterium]